jgi:trimethylamine:corrinoid methyltransferase-like protein
LLFRIEQHFPSAVIDRRGDPNTGDILARARERVNELVNSYQRPKVSPQVEDALLAIASREAKAFGLEHLPGIEMPATSSA